MMFCEPVEARPRPSLALTFTSYLLCHPTIKDDLLRTCRPGLHNVVKSLKKSLVSLHYFYGFGVNEARHSKVSRSARRVKYS